MKLYCILETRYNWNKTDIRDEWVEVVSTLTRAEHHADAIWSNLTPRERKITEVAVIEFEPTDEVYELADKMYEGADDWASLWAAYQDVNGGYDINHILSTVNFTGQKYMIVLSILILCKIIHSNISLNYQYSVPNHSCSRSGSRLTSESKSNHANSLSIKSSNEL